MEWCPPVSFISPQCCHLVIFIHTWWWLCSEGICVIIIWPSTTVCIGHISRTITIRILLPSCCSSLLKQNNIKYELNMIKHHIIKFINENYWCHGLSLECYWSIYECKIFLSHLIFVILLNFNANEHASYVSTLVTDGTGIIAHLMSHCFFSALYCPFSQPLYDKMCYIRDLQFW